jgi:hypothetical protein
MDFLKVLFGIASGILTLFKLYELFKDKKEGMKKIFFNPLGIGLTISLILTILIFAVHWESFHYGDCKSTVKKVHDTVYVTKFKKDTIYIKSPSQKNFNNKINKVNTLNQN